MWKKFIIATLNSAGLTNGCEDEKKGNLFGFLFFIAEREGFEPPVPLSTPVFKTGAFDHSAISPDARS